MAKSDPKPKKQGRIAQIRQTYRLTKESDPRIGWILLGIFLACFVPVVLLGLWLAGGVNVGLVMWVLLGFAVGLLVVTIVFGRRAERAAYASIEGQPGAAAAVLQSLRSGWFTTPAVAVTKNQDVVHRVIGRPGVVLVSEGPSSRAANLLTNERKRTSRWVGDVPIHEIEAGNETGQVPLMKLQRTVMRLPRTLKPAEVSALRKRLDALSQSPVPMPKGPLPKNVRMPRGPRA